MATTDSRFNGHGLATPEDALSAVMALQCPAWNANQLSGMSQSTGNVNGGRPNAGEHQGNNKKNSAKAKRERPNHPFHCRNVRLNAKICQVSNKGNVWELLDLVESCHNEMNIVNLSTILHRAARLGKKANTVRALSGHPQLARIKSRVQAELLAHQNGDTKLANADSNKEVEALPRCLATIAWSYATLQVYDKAAFNLIATLAISCLDTFKAFELANLLWAFAKVHIPAPRLFEASMAHLPSESSNLTPVSLSMATWAYVTLYPQVPAMLLKRLAAAFLEMLQFAKSQEISNMCWALATAKMTKPQVFYRLGTEAAAKLRSFNIQELANTCWAFSRAGQVHAELFSVVAELFVEKPGLAFSFHGQALANMMWALAKQVALGGGNTSRIQSIAVCLMPACCQVLEQFKPQEFSSVLWSIAKLGFKSGNNADSDRIFEAAAEKDTASLNSLSVQGLTNILYAFTEYMDGSPQFSNFLGVLSSCIAARLNEFEVIGLLYVAESWHLLLSKGSPVRDLQKLAFLVALQVLKHTDLTPSSLSRLVAAAGCFSPEMRQALANIIVQQQANFVGNPPDELHLINPAQSGPAQAPFAQQQVPPRRQPAGGNQRGQVASSKPTVSANSFPASNHQQGRTEPMVHQADAGHSFEQDPMASHFDPEASRGVQPASFAQQRPTGNSVARSQNVQPAGAWQSLERVERVEPQDQGGRTDDPMYVQLPAKEARGADLDKSSFQRRGGDIPLSPKGQPFPQRNAGGRGPPPGDMGAAAQFQNFTPGEWNEVPRMMHAAGLDQQHSQGGQQHPNLQQGTRFVGNMRQLVRPQDARSAGHLVNDGQMDNHPMRHMFESYEHHDTDSEVESRRDPSELTGPVGTHDVSGQNSDTVAARCVWDAQNIQRGGGYGVSAQANFSSGLDHNAYQTSSSSGDTGYNDLHRLVQSAPARHLHGQSDGTGYPVRSNYESYEHHDTDSEVDSVRDLQDGPPWNMDDQQGASFGVSEQAQGGATNKVSSHGQVSALSRRRGGRVQPPVRLNRFSPGIAESEEENRVSFQTSEPDSPAAPERRSNDMRRPSLNRDSFSRDSFERHPDHTRSSFQSFAASSDGEGRGANRKTNSFNRPSWADEDPDDVDITPLFNFAWTSEGNTAGDANQNKAGNLERHDGSSLDGQHFGSLERSDMALERSLEDLEE